MTNRYQDKLAERKARLEAQADKASAESKSTYKRAKGLASAIPFGQPILVGHHSEKRDRNYRGRIHNTFGKAFALQDKAAHYADRAARVGTGGISSDDPDAIEKLRAELAALEVTQDRMKKANKAIRMNHTPEAQLAALVAQGYSEVDAQDLLKPDFCKRVGFPSYRLSNNNANMRRISDRIKVLEAASMRSDKEETGAGYTYREDTEDNRVMFLFPGKPDEKVREVLKRHAFKWSPSRPGQPWVRQLNNSGLYHASEVRKALDAMSAEAAG